MVCEAEGGARADTVKEIGNGDGEGGKGVVGAEVDFSCWAGDPADGEVGENGWGSDSEGRGEGAPASDGSSAGLVLASRTSVSGMRTVDA